MKVKSITVHEYIGENPPTESIYLYNDDCQLVQEILPFQKVSHHYQPDGNEFEELTLLPDDSMRQTRFEYDNEGDYVGEVCKDGNGKIIYKEIVNWLKPGRVVSTCRIYDDNTILSLRRYFHKDGRLAYVRGYGFFCNFEYDPEGNLLCEKLGSDTEDKNKPDWYSIRRFNKDGLLIGETDKDGVSSTREYEFDEYGNWIRVEGRIEDGLVSMIAVRELEYTPGIWVGKKIDFDSPMNHITYNPLFLEA